MTKEQTERYNKHFGPEWTQMLGPFLSSKEYAQIGIELTKQKKEGILITPTFEDMFRAFRECPYHTVHSIILGQDVYPGINKDKTLIADGIAFSGRENSEPPPSLNSVLEAIDTSVYQESDDWCPTAVFNHDRMETTWDLKYWAKQGLLLINCAYSTVVQRPNSHMSLWKPFTEYLMSLLDKRKDSLGFILMGSHAKSYRNLITNPSHAIFECEHPAAAMYKKRKWDHNNVFASLTDFQKKTNNIKIKW